ncbi:MAG: hypothetical protein ISS93_01000 [Candidatus Aenigmarchaeota archaeon]|nr:hypothetical protein [Candidatus Aenigmarchaeota archaeon]
MKRGFSQDIAIARPGTFIVDEFYYSGYHPRVEMAESLVDPNLRGEPPSDYYDSRFSLPLSYVTALYDIGRIMKTTRIVSSNGSVEKPAIRGNVPRSVLSAAVKIYNYYKNGGRAWHNSFFYTLPSHHPQPIGSTRKKGKIFGNHYKRVNLLKRTKKGWKIRADKSDIHDHSIPKPGIIVPDYPTFDGFGYPLRTTTDYEEAISLIKETGLTEDFAKEEIGFFEILDGNGEPTDNPNGIFGATTARSAQGGLTVALIKPDTTDGDFDIFKAYLLE